MQQISQTCAAWPSRSSWHPSDMRILRKNAIALLHETMCTYTKSNKKTYSNMTAKDFAIEVERICYFRLFLTNKTAYMRKIKLLCQHIPGTDLQLQSMHPQEIASLDAEELQQAPVVTFSRDALVIQDIYGAKSEHRCRKCGSLDTTCTMREERAGDEGITTRYECVCGFKWKDN